MRYVKIFVEVIAKFSPSGGIRPLEIVWSDGTRYSVDRVKFVDRAPSRVGSLINKRFTVTVCGQQKYLYYVESEERWFVEKGINENDITQ